MSGAAPVTPERPQRVRAIRLRPRSVAAIAIMTVAGLAAFLWPLFVAPTSNLVGTSQAPLLFALILPPMTAVVLFEIAEGGLDVKAVAMLGVLSAIGAALRPLGAGSAGIETVFFLLVLGGRVFGPGFGFVLGSTTLFASALITGGVGPWLPFQMLASSLVGLGAGLLPTRPHGGRAEIWMLMAYGAIAGLAYGFLMNMSFWPFASGLGTGLTFVPGAPVLDNVHRFVVFSLTTSLGWDIGRAITNVVLIRLTGRPVLGALRRAARRAAFEAPVRFQDVAESRDPARSAP